MKQKRASMANPAFDQMRVLKVSQALNMETKIVERLHGDFERYAGKQSQMSFGQVMEVLKREQNVFVNRAQLEETFNIRSNTVEFPEFCKVYMTIKKLMEEADGQQAEILNSFVALGGQPDKGGYIKKSMIINIIKNQFQLTFDIEEMLDRAVDSDNLDYDSFCQIFVKVQESQRDVMRNSLAIITTSRPKQDQDGLKVKYQDFESWLMLNGM